MVQRQNRAGAAPWHFVNEWWCRPCWPQSAQVKWLSGGEMAANYQQIVCVQCDQTEEYCTCEKYCTICKGQSGVRLGADGLYYCPDCREACDVPLANVR
jgi:hypothetical protein